MGICISVPFLFPVTNSLYPTALNCWAGQDFVEKFACWTKATLAEEWAENVTHVIVGKGAGTSWCRSFEVLMAILLGKWVVRFECQYLNLGSFPIPRV